MAEELKTVKQILDIASERLSSIERYGPNNASSTVAAIERDPELRGRLFKALGPLLPKNEHPINLAKRLERLEKSTAALLGDQGGVSEVLTEHSKLLESIVDKVAPSSSSSCQDDTVSDTLRISARVGMVFDVLAKELDASLKESQEQDGLISVDGKRACSIRAIVSFLNQLTKRDGGVGAFHNKTIKYLACKMIRLVIQMPNPFYSTATHKLRHKVLTKMLAHIKERKADEYNPAHLNGQWDNGTVVDAKMESSAIYQTFYYLVKDAAHRDIYKYLPKISHIIVDRFKNSTMGLNYFDYFLNLHESVSLITAKHNQGVFDHNDLVVLCDLVDATTYLRLVEASTPLTRKEWQYERLALLWKHQPNQSFTTLYTTMCKRHFEVMFPGPDEDLVLNANLYADRRNSLHAQHCKFMKASRELMHDVPQALQTLDGLDDEVAVKVRSVIKTVDPQYYDHRDHTFMFRTLERDLRKVCAHKHFEQVLYHYGTRSIQDAVLKVVEDMKSGKSFQEILKTYDELMEVVEPYVVKRIFERYHEKLIHILTGRKLLGKHQFYAKQFYDSMYQSFIRRFEELIIVVKEEEMDRSGRPNKLPYVDYIHGLAEELEWSYQFCYNQKIDVLMKQPLPPSMLKTLACAQKHVNEGNIVKARECFNLTPGPIFQIAINLREHLGDVICSQIDAFISTLTWGDCPWSDEEGLLDTNDRLALIGSKANRIRKNVILLQLMYFEEKEFKPFDTYDQIQQFLNVGPNISLMRLGAILTRLILLKSCVCKLIGRPRNHTELVIDHLIDFFKKNGSFELTKSEEFYVYHMMDTLYFNQKYAGKFEALKTSRVDHKEWISNLKTLKAKSLEDRFYQIISTTLQATEGEKIFISKLRLSCLENIIRDIKRDDPRIGKKIKVFYDSIFFGRFVTVTENGKFISFEFMVSFIANFYKHLQKMTKDEVLLISRVIGSWTFFSKHATSTSKFALFRLAYHDAMGELYRLVPTLDVIGEENPPMAEILENKTIDQWLERLEEYRKGLMTPISTPATMWDDLYNIFHNFQKEVMMILHHDHRRDIYFMSKESRTEMLKEGRHRMLVDFDRFAFQVPDFDREHFTRMFHAMIARLFGIKVDHTAIPPKAVKEFIHILLRTYWMCEHKTTEEPDSTFHASVNSRNLTYWQTLYSSPIMSTHGSFIEMIFLSCEFGTHSVVLIEEARQFRDEEGYYMLPRPYIERWMVLLLSPTESDDDVSQPLTITAVKQFFQFKSFADEVVELRELVMQLTQRTVDAEELRATVNALSQKVEETERVNGELLLKLDEFEMTIQSLKGSTSSFDRPEEEEEESHMQKKARMCTDDQPNL